ncbi:MAG: hypothetical protein N2572_00320 [Syntrophales bacterium]|nr:hypothetical protein [Syntrophales bacterium]
MKSTNQKTDASSPRQLVEDIISEKMEHITTLLSNGGGRKSQLYDEVLEMVERSLFKIALKRTNNVKSKAADYLGINRNTFHKKMNKLHIDMTSK